ncbi:TPA: hypothetical protein ACYTMU_001699, partial [Neisseria meningitidis]
IPAFAGMTVEGFCFSDRFLWFFGYWIPAFAGMTGCKFLLRRGWIPAFTGMTKFQTAFKRYGCVNNGRVGFSLPIPAILAVFAFLSFSLFLPFPPNPAN